MGPYEKIEMKKAVLILPYFDSPNAALFSSLFRFFTVWIHQTIDMLLDLSF